MSMSQNEINVIAKELYEMRGELIGIGRDIADIKEGRMTLCAIHTEKLASIETKIDRIEHNQNGRRAEYMATENGSKWGFQFGKLKAAGVPAIIIAVLIGVAILNYVESRTVREESVKTIQDLQAETRMQVSSMMRGIKHDREQP